MKTVKNKKGFHIIEMSRDELSLLGWGISNNKCLCSRCNNVIEGPIYYNAVLHDTMDKDCLKQWYDYTSSISELGSIDKTIMDKNFKYVLNYLDLTEVDSYADLDLDLDNLDKLSVWDLPNLTDICYKEERPSLDYKMYAKILNHVGNDLYIYMIWTSPNEKGEMFKHFTKDFFPMITYKPISKEEFTENRKAILKELKEILVNYEFDDV